ncbi:MAG: PH domain-containing protein [Chthoniobacterales bacterium]
MAIYLYLNGTRRGPFEEEQVRRMLSDRVLEENDLGSTADGSEWHPLANLLSSAFSPPPSPPNPVRASPAALGGYARATLDSNETVFYKTSIHWMIFLRYASLALLVFVFVVIPFAIGMQALVATQKGWFALPLPILILIPPAVLLATSELVVTNRRVLIKTGAVNRQTLEMFITKIESVGVRQSFLGRLLDYGTVIIRGTGGSDEPFQMIARPIEFRNAVQRMQSQADAK